MNLNSLWIKTTEFPSYPSLEEHLNVDVCVVGGGIAGLTTAYLLTQEGRKVCVLEDAEIGIGQTGKTSAHLSYILEYRYFELVKIHGFEKARLAAQAHAKAIEKISQIIAKEKIDCDFKFVNGYLFLGPQDSSETLNKEMSTLQNMGFSGVYSLPEAPIISFNTGQTLCVPRQAIFHPLKYVQHLAQCIVESGSFIFQKTHVTEIFGGATAHARTEDGFLVHAQDIVVATNSPINNLFTLHTKQSPYRSYVMAFQIPKGCMHAALYWDTEEPYHYIRTVESESGDLLIVGGEDHKTGQRTTTQECFGSLENWTRARFPMAQKVVHCWSGQVMESIDGLAYLGRNPGADRNIYVISGDTGNGLTHSTIGAMIITDQIHNRKNRWEDVFNPSRVNVQSLGNFLKENFNVALQYRNWFKPQSAPHIQDLKNNEGTVINEGLHKIATYKDPTGVIHQMSAMCPHLGCMVAWNDTEKTWDCPCHGSRFECTGKVIEGPATCDLKTLDSLTPQYPEKENPHEDQPSESQ